MTNFQETARDFLVIKKHENQGATKIFLSEEFYKQLKKEVSDNVLRTLKRKGTIYMTPYSVNGVKSSFEFHYGGERILKFNFEY